MTSNKNLVLTEKAIGRHTKRLQKELSTINHTIKLSEAQNMLSRILGMKDFHELKEKLKLNECLLEKKVLANKNLNEIMDFYDAKMKSLNFVKENLNNFVQRGEFKLFLNHYNSKDPDIINYIKENALTFFKTAVKYKQNLIVHFLLENKAIILENLTEDDINTIFIDSIEYNFSIFEHIFYTLQFPAKLNKNDASKWIHYIVVRNHLPYLKKFLLDDRISFQKDFFWNKWGSDLTKEFVYNFCTLNKACEYGNLSMVKFLIEEEGISPIKNGTTVQDACQSGNLELVKYLIEDKNAIYNHFRANPTRELSGMLNGKGNMNNAPLDESVLASAVQSNNTKLLDYLMKHKKMDIAEHDYLALRVALIGHFPCYQHLLKTKKCKDYVTNNAQAIFDTIIYKNMQLYDRKKVNKADYEKLQCDIVKYLFDNYPITLNEVVYETNNFDLIQYLKSIVIKH